MIYLGIFKIISCFAETCNISKRVAFVNIDLLEGYLYENLDREFSDYGLSLSELSALLSPVGTISLCGMLETSLGNIMYGINTNHNFKRWMFIHRENFLLWRLEYTEN